MIPRTHFRLRSFVRRDSRRTDAQERAFQACMPSVGLYPNTPWDYQAIFGADAPVFLEIGFGLGQSLLALAQARPDIHLIGVETHKPGIGAMCQGIQMYGLKNLRIGYGDIIDCLEKSIPEQSLDGIQIFFPDPWQKRRHHARRLIQPAFIKLVVSKLKTGGSLHIATDWEDYAKHITEVLAQDHTLLNQSDSLNSQRSCYRPHLSKFEARALAAGRRIWEWQLAKI